MGSKVTPWGLGPIAAVDLPPRGSLPSPPWSHRTATAVSQWPQICASLPQELSPGVAVHDLRDKTSDLILLSCLAVQLHYRQPPRPVILASVMPQMPFWDRSSPVPQALPSMGTSFQGTSGNNLASYFPAVVHDSRL